MAKSQTPDYSTNLADTPYLRTSVAHSFAKKKIKTIGDFVSKSTDELIRKGIDRDHIALLDKALAQSNIFRPGSESVNEYVKDVTPDTAMAQVPGIAKAVVRYLDNMGISTVQQYQAKTFKELRGKTIASGHLRDNSLQAHTIDKLDLTMAGHGIFRDELSEGKRKALRDKSQALTGSPASAIYVPDAEETALLLQSAPNYTARLERRPPLPEADSILERVMEIGSKNKGKQR